MVTNKLIQTTIILALSMTILLSCFERCCAMKQFSEGDDAVNRPSPFIKEHCQHYTKIANRTQSLHVAVNPNIFYQSNVYWTKKLLNKTWYQHIVWISKERTTYTINEDYVIKFWARMYNARNITMEFCGAFKKINEEKCVPFTGTLDVNQANPSRPENYKFQPYRDWASSLWILDDDRDFEQDVLLVAQCENVYRPKWSGYWYGECPDWRFKLFYNDWRPKPLSDYALVGQKLEQRICFPVSKLKMVLALKAKGCLHAVPYCLSSSPSFVEKFAAQTVDDVTLSSSLYSCSRRNISFNSLIILALTPFLAPFFTH